MGDAEPRPAAQGPELSQRVGKSLLAKFLFKANDDILSFCACEGEPAMSTGQLDCPWCGCGWMISCSKCTKSFIFAEVRETDIGAIRSNCPWIPA